MNTIVTAKLITKAVISSMKKAMVMPALVDSSYNAEFKNKQGGNTIHIPKLTKFDAKDFTGTIEIQDINEGEVYLSLNVFKDVSFTLAVEDRVLKTPQDKARFTQRYVVPARDALLGAMEQKITDQFLTVPRYVKGIAGSPANFGDLAKIKAELVKAGVPVGQRKAVVGADTAADMLGSIPQLNSADVSGSTQGVTDAVIGKKSSVEFYESAWVYEAKAKGNANAGTVDAPVAAFDGKSKISLTGVTDSQTILKGNILSFDNGALVAIDEDITFSGTDVTIDCWNLTEDLAGGESFTVVEMGAGVVMAPGAIAFASVPLAIEGDNGELVSAPEFPALTLRATHGYDVNTKKTVYSFDFLAGTKVVNKDAIWRINGR
jgi:hypothetical protein